MGMLGQVWLGLIRLVKVLARLDQARLIKLGQVAILARRHSLAEVVQDGVEDQDGARQAHDGEGLTREEPVQDPDDESGHEGLDGRDSILGRVAQEAAEGDEGGEASEVDEDHGGDALQRERVLEVGPVPRHLPLDVVDQTAERLTWKSRFKDSEFASQHIRLGQVKLT